MREDGIQLKSTRHCKYQSGHHFVWIPYKRKRIFRGETIILATKRYITEAIENNDMELLAIEIDRVLMDHVHVFVSIPPRISAAQAVNVMKGYSSRHLRKEFPELKQLDDEQLWARSYYWGTTGNVSAQTVKRYIEECQVMILLAYANAGTSLYLRAEAGGFIRFPNPPFFYKNTEPAPRTSSIPAASIEAILTERTRQPEEFCSP